METTAIQKKITFHEILLHNLCAIVIDTRIKHDTSASHRVLILENIVKVKYKLSMKKRNVLFGITLSFDSSIHFL